MNIWHDINPERIKKDRFIAVIEISKNTKNKYELDKETGMLKLDRILYTSTHYPTNYGFIPRTYAADYDPLDVLVICSEAIQPLCIVECYPIGVIRMIDGGMVDDKIIAIPYNDPTWNYYQNVDDLSPHIVQELEHFFEVYKQLEHKDTCVLKVLGEKDATTIIENSIIAYNEKFSK